MEVTSPSTRATDRREKLEAYMRVASLRLYLIVDQRRKHVIVYARDEAGEWLRDEIDGDGAIEIPFLETLLPLTEIYEDVTLMPRRVREGEDWDALDQLSLAPRPRVGSAFRIPMASGSRAS